MNISDLVWARVVKGGPSGPVSGSAGLVDPFFSHFEELSSGASHLLVRARRYGRWYVLKALRHDLRGNAFYEEWLLKEYSVGNGLDHPGIVKVVSLEPVEGLGPCIVMEWAEGQPPDRWLASRPSSSARRQVLDQILDAVAYCHAHGIYHHDLKPSNIIVGSDLRVRVIDFGLSDGPQYAAFKHAGGTVGFAAPKQEAGATADQRADIYALGRLTRLLLPHRHPLAVRRATRPDPSRRPDSVADYRRLLRPLWPLALAAVALLAALAVWAAQPSQRLHTVQLDSGQTLLVREVQRLPQRQVAIVAPADTATLTGRMVIPAAVRHRGLRWQVVAIERRAFRLASRLTAVALPPSLRSIGDQAFGGCLALADTLVIPPGLQHIGVEAFNDCPRLTTVLWQARHCVGPSTEDGQKYPYFFRCLNLREAIIDTGVRHLPIQLFSGIRNLERLTVREGLVESAKDLAASSHRLRQASLPSSLHTLAHGAFYETALDSITLPDALEEIGPYAFAYCDSLRVVRMGSKVRSIGSYCFTECHRLREVEILSPVPPEVQSTTFNQLPSTAVLRVPPHALDAYRAHPLWGRFNVRCR